MQLTLAITGASGAILGRELLRALEADVREAPFNRIHLRNMLLASEAGATIFPCMPAFYQPNTDPAAMTRQFICRVLAYIGLPQPDAYVWKPEE